MRKVTTEDLSALLEQLAKEKTKDIGPPKGGFTTSQIARATGLCRAAIQDRILALVEGGVIECGGRCPSVSVSGQRTQIPYYVFTKKGKK